MPKKSVAARNAVQRKARPQKSFELVRQAAENEASVQEEIETSAIATLPAEEKVNGIVPKQAEEPFRSAEPKSASARMAARRQATQKQQRSVEAMVTPEHYKYVRQELITIAILSVIMCAIIITLYVVLG